MPDSNDPLTDFILTLLDDDEGINEESYGKMMYALSLMNMNDLVSWLDSNVRATDGRFYVLEQRVDTAPVVANDADKSE